MGRLGSRLPRYPIGTTGVTDVINLEDNEKINFGDSNDATLYWDGTYFRIDGSAQEILFGLTIAGQTIIYGGATTLDKLTLRANSVNARPLFQFRGNELVYMDLYLGKSFYLYENNVEFFDFNRSAVEYVSDAVTGSATKYGWSTKTTTGNIVGHEIDASTNLTMGTNFGATGLKINVIAPNGSGKSQGIDLSSLAVDFPVFKFVADAITTAGTLSQQVAIDIGGTTYYLYAYTTGS